MLNEFEKKIYKFIKNYNIYEKYDKILLAISGGKDSMSLLKVMYKISKIMNLEIGVAHFNHKLRKESEEEKIFVEEEAKKLKIKYYYGEANEKNYKNIELSARNMRYDFLFDIAKKNNYNKIATAHHMSDLVETIIYRLSRGTGIYGVSGLLPINEMLTRPMLTVTLKEIINYVTIDNVKYKIDKSNFENNYSRNRIRNKILPELELINDNFENNFFKFARIAWEYRQQVENEYLKRIHQNENKFYFDIKKDIFDEEVLRLFFLRCKQYPPNYEETKKIIKMGSKKSKQFKGIKIEKNKNTLIIERE
ncbi:tRNA lysidine(34) synthetase TilS [Geotoga petraea]|uniref:tRNA(Ile)-lysidine synthase n=1 Tax=Geotoga petraea TaxID=28234 RepID=A0A1G6JIP8_9BACT|nr:tRNA lysidine(34) synthetase TilS [Geotoga petraea]MDK2946420.1 tRNA(Ile)-lysidine synthase [Geotoga sp.]TGG88233.1 tRNA lysidine(34) synthetase TilS [Geotoga petraea]SDC18600.1 tRNA(Ile)-lysidine synthase [Geotoga petraea]